MALLIRDEERLAEAGRAWGEGEGRGGEEGEREEQGGEIWPHECPSLSPPRPRKRRDRMRLICGECGGRGGGAANKEGRTVFAEHPRWHPTGAGTNPASPGWSGPAPDEARYGSSLWRPTYGSPLWEPTMGAHYESPLWARQSVHIQSQSAAGYCEQATRSTVSY